MAGALHCKVSRQLFLQDYAHEMVYAKHNIAGVSAESNESEKQQGTIHMRF